MYTNHLKAILKIAARVFAILSFATAAHGQVNLTVAPTNTTMPDGTVVPMWGYFCGTAVSGSAATCAALNPAAGAAATWSPVVITVPVATTGPTSLTINLTNNLSFTPRGATTPNAIPTSLVIVGQVGGGLGTPTTTPSPSHATAQACPSWFIAANPPGTACTAPTPGATTNIPPLQANRVQSFSTEVAAGATTSLTWASLRPGTYLLESGTHPSIQVPMGLIGVLVVTTAPSGATAGTAYPGTTTIPAVQYNAEVPLEFSEIDPVQNTEVDQAVRTAGFSETAVWTRMNAFGPVTALTLTNAGSGYTSTPTVTIATPTGGSPVTATATATVGALVSSIAVTAGGSGYSAAPTVTINDATGTGATATATVVGGVVTAITVTNRGSLYTAPTVTITDTTGTGATATAAVAGSYGVIYALNLTNGGEGYTTAPTVTIAAAPATGTTAAATATFTLGGCGGGAHTCYPPAVNYTPFYYLINGVAFNKTNPGASLFQATAGVGTTTGITGTVLARLVNAGVRMHVPSIVGSFTQGFNGAGGTATVGGFTLIAEDGNPVPGVQVAGATTAPAAPRVQTDVFMAAGKVFDVMVNAPPGGVSAIAITSGGTGFLSGSGGNGTLPACSTGVTTGCVLISGGGGTGATATATVTAGVITAFTITNPGNGYTAQPSVTVTDVTGSSGTGFTQGTVALNNPGSVSIYARDLGLSGNSSTRDAGMIAYVGVNGTPSTLLAGIEGAGTGSGAGTGAFAAAVARPDSYNAMVAGQPFSVSDVSKGVIANDTNVYGVVLVSGPTNGTLTCNAQPQNPVPGICANGTFTYTPNTGSMATSDSFKYCANTPASAATACPANLTATVTLAASSLKGNPTAVNVNYTANTASYLKIPSPGLLALNSDPSGLPITVVTSPAPTLTGFTGGTLVLDAQGGFAVNLSPAPTTGTTVTFNYQVQDSQGRYSAGSATACSNSPPLPTGCGTVTITFPAPSNLSVTVVDAQEYSNCQGDSSCISKLTTFTDYRWIIEEDKTFWVDPNCTTNSSITTPGCASIVGPAGQTTIPTFGTNFHASHMDFVAQGCTGPLSCEGGQTMLDTNPTSSTYGTHIPAVCDLGNGACRPDPNCSALPCITSGGTTAVMPSSVHLDPARRYYISILPGDAGNPFNPANTSPPTGCDTPIINTSTGPALNNGCGHTMGGAPIPPACNILGGPNACVPGSAFAPVRVTVLPTPLPTGKLSVVVFEDDFPLNGEQDGGGGTGTGVVAPLEPGLGGFNLVLWDTYGGLGDVTGQDTYDMFNMPLTNSLAGTVDPTTGLDACPLTANPLVVTTGAGSSQTTTGPNNTGGITGMIVTCPKYESDGKSLSPLAGQAVIANLMPEKFSVQAYPGADRIARGEEWLQTNTLDGQHPHDSFIRIGEPSYFQEFGPGGYHVSIGFANPAIINARHDAVCAGAYGPVGPCTNTISGQVDVQRISRTPDQRLYPSGSRDAFTWTQCWVSLGDPDAEDFMFTKCDANGNFAFNHVPGGNWRLTIGDQWNDQIIDGLSTPANVGCIPAAGATTCTIPPGGTANLNLGNIGVQQWQSNLYTRVFVDDNKNGIPDPGEIGVPQVYTHIRYRDGHNSNVLLTDPNGIANFNETFPLFNWYVVEPDTTRYKRTGTHVVYDAGGPADGSKDAKGVSYCGPANGARPCGTSTAYNNLANTYEAIPLPADLSVPGAVYCASADCGNEAADFAAGTPTTTEKAQQSSTGRIDPPWVTTEGWSGMTSQGNWIEFGVAPYASCPPACATVTTTPAGATTPTTMQVAENGGIHGFVDYASTRPFDDASQMIEQPWEPYVPRVTINLYQEGFAADGVTPTLTMVDTTQTASWDDWAQGFYPNSTAGSGSAAGQKPYMSCPGQGTATGTNADPFYFSLYDQPEYLDWYNSQHNGGTLHTLPYNSQYKCYDSMHIWNQIQPAPYDGYYSFPSSLGVQASGANAGKPVTTVGSTNGVTASMPGTNCTVCVANPDTSDVYRVGTPMLPPGKYVVEVIMPPGYEVYKEEDKNLLIGDNYIAPVAQEFAGLGGSIFIVPDQASVASMYDPANQGYNPTNFQNSTVNLGLNEELSGVPGFPGYQNPLWPCVGELRTVPDYLSLFPHALETAPFAGATRPLCDRKEVTLGDQMNVRNNFFVFTSAHIAAKFTGVITNDFTSEFDPFSPQFGEKFSPPNMPVSTRDYLGNEVSRTYADHWGTYESMVYSSWEVNPPNITGYSPNMMVQCMNDAGPIPDPNNPGAMIVDPLYNPAYSQFCYEEPYMPGLTTYLDTPVVPTQAFVGAAYNDADCSYPDTTPAIAEVDGDGIGPWVSATGPRKLTITALGNVQVENSGYAGPSANVAPFNQKKVQRHYGFGSAANPGSVSIGGVNVPACSTSLTTGCISSWMDNQIVLTVPSGVPNCPVQQQTQYGGSTAKCGQLVITTANTAPAGQPSNARQSIDAVTVTIGGKAPVHVAASQTIQSYIDNAAPGDLIIVDPACTTPSGPVSCTTAGVTKNPASHKEMLIMWKPVRLQGAGAASTIVDANSQPAGKLLDPWRRHVNCLFGLALNGTPYTASNAYDPTSTYSCPDAGWNYFGTALTAPGTGGASVPNAPQIDRVPLEAILGWDANLNGNVAELLQEPTLMGAYEGAGITVLAKGVEFHGQIPWNDGTEGGAFPAAATLLTGVVPNPGSTGGDGLPVGDKNPFCHTGMYDPVTGAFTVTSQTNPYPSNFMCNPSSIDGLSITDSSQGGGGIFVHGWAHHLEIANNRIMNNAGTLTGGISVGQGEFAGPYIVGSATNAAPGSCSDGTGLVLNQHMPDCFQLLVNVHNNMITANAALGDELFSGTLSGGGGATFCTGNDYYKFNYNWVCGNVSAGEGGGMVHLGEIFDGDIEHNSFVLNQSINPTIPTNGGGIMVQGTPDTDPTCPGVPDSDCPPGLSDGTGPNLLINANLIEGNSADSGSGGGIRMNQVNGTEVATFAAQPELWNSVRITNNIIVNNIAGWDGAGISLQDALRVSIINNTIAHNDTLASSGVLTTSIGTPQASAPAGNCTMAGPTGPNTASCPQPAGVASTLNSTLLASTFTGQTVECPDGMPNCQHFSDPILQNNVIWQNRSFQIGITGPATGNQNQQNLVALFNATFTPGGTATVAPVQTATGQCSPGVSYWEIGVRGDTGPSNHGSGFSLRPRWSVLTDASDYPNAFNLGADPTPVSQYCNGSRVPPECSVADGCGGPGGFGVPPGIADAVTPNPVFSLTPAATVDEGNNWINVSWGPLALTNPAVTGGPNLDYGGGPALANYVLLAGSPAIDYVPRGESHPSTDFFGNPRPDPTTPRNCFDVGAVEFQGAVSGAGSGCSAAGPTLSAINPASGIRGTSFTVTLTGNNLQTPSNITAGGGITVTNIVPAPGDPTTVTATFTISATAALTTRNVVFTGANGTATLPNGFTVVPPTVTSIGPVSGLRGSTNLQIDIFGTGLSGATGVNLGGGITLVAGSLSVTPDGTHLTAQVNIAATAGLTVRNVRVVYPGGTQTPVNTAVTFTVLGPTVTGITPATGTHGTTVAVTINGAGLTGATNILFPTGGGITVVAGSIVVTNAGGTLTATLTIATGAARTIRNVQVVTPIGTTPVAPGVTFTVN